MNMRGLLVATAVLIGVSVASPASAAVTFYTDYTAWSAAVTGAIVMEDFSGAGPTAPGLSVSNGAITHTSATFGDAWRATVVPGGASTTWSFASPIYAFAGSWDLQSQSVNGPGTGIDLYLDGVTLIGSISSSYAGMFVGFVSTTAFSSVQERAGSETGATETYEVSPILFAGAVPEPSTWAMLILGFAGVSLLSYRRRMRSQLA